VIFLPYLFNIYIILFTLTHNHYLNFQLRLLTCLFEKFLIGKFYYITIQTPLSCDIILLQFLSFADRLVLLKFVLSSLSVYFLSFFKAPAGIISSIESIFKKKNWGWGEVNRKIAWIKWDSICLPKEDGGLRVRRVGFFNLSLLGKWCWRMLVDKEGLWYLVLKGHYGEMGGRLREGGRNSSVWWKTVCQVREGVGLGVGN